MPEVSLSTESTNNRQPAPMPQKILYDRKSAAYAISVSQRALDYLVANKQLTTIRLGAKVMIAHSELIRFSRSNHLSLTASPGFAQ
jgi:hypothetical protein